MSIDPQRRRWLALIVFGVPLIAYLFFWWAEFTLQVQFDFVSVWPQHTMFELCYQIAISYGQAKCPVFDGTVFTVFKQVSLAAMGIGVLLLGGIYALGRLSERQSRFSVLFPLSLGLLFVALGLLIVLDGLIATLVIYTIIYQVMGWAMNAVLLGLPIGAIVCVFSLISTARSVYRPEPAAVVAAELTRENSPELWSLISRIARTVHAREPDHVIAGLQPTFYASLCDHKLFGSERILRGETVYVSLPYLRMINSTELSAILAHELGHFKSGDVQYVMRMIPLFDRVATTLERLRSLEGWARFAAYPAIPLLEYFLERFNVAYSAISRDREFDADRIGARFAGSHASASALVKSAAAWRFWPPVADTVFGHEKWRVRAKNASLAAHHALMRQLDECDQLRLLEDIGDVITPHPFDTHPPTAKRIEAFGVTLSGHVEWLHREGDAASTLIVDFEALEEVVTSDLWRLRQLVDDDERESEAPSAASAVSS